MKQSGLYQLTGNNGVKGYYLFGTVKKITYGKKSNITYYVPVYSSGGQIWYRASTWGKPDEIRLGDYIVVRAEAVDLHVYNGFTFHDLRRATVEAVKK